MTKEIKRVAAVVVSSALLAGESWAAVLVSGAGAAGAGSVWVGPSLVQQAPGLDFSLAKPVVGVSLPSAAALLPAVALPAAAAVRAAEPAVVLKPVQAARGARYREVQKRVDSVRERFSEMAAAPLVFDNGRVGADGAAPAVAAEPSGRTGLLRAVGSFFGIPEEPATPAKPVLSGEALEDLRKASKSGFMVRVLKKEVAGRERLVVLLGEVHYKGRDAAAAGKDVLRHFDAIGTELANDGPDLLSRVFIACFVSTVGRAMSLLSSLGFEVQTSTIFEAIRRIEGLRRADPAAPALTRPQLRAILKENPRTFAEPALRPDGTALPKLILLEEGHTPDFKEDVAKLQILASMALPALHVALAAIPGLQPALAAVQLAYGPLGVYTMLGTVLSPKFGQEDWFKTLFPGAVGLLEARNKTMAGNLSRALRDYPDIDKMLVIFGMLHMAGMKRLLMEDGFREVPLSEL